MKECSYYNRFFGNRVAVEGGIANIFLELDSSVLYYWIERAGDEKVVFRFTSFQNNDFQVLAMLRDSKYIDIGILHEVNNKPINRQTI